MLKKPHKFEEVIGHDVQKKYITDRIKSQTFPRFVIFEGAEGLGKTALAMITSVALNYGLEDSEEKERVTVNVIDKKGSTDCIKRYNMAQNSEKNTAKEVLDELSPKMSSTGRKVVFCDECHRMDYVAQDTLLEDIEFIPKDTYLIMSTTDTSNMKPALLSRAVKIPLHNLKSSEMLSVLRSWANERNIRVQGGDAMLRMIAAWSDNKPRAALNVIEAFGENGIMTQEMVNEFIGYLDIDEVLPLVVSLGGSMTFGLTYINEMRLSDSILDITIELLKIKLGQPSYKVSVEALRRIKDQLKQVSEESMIKFIHSIAMHQPLNRSSLVAAYTSAHVAFSKLFVKDSETQMNELRQKAAIDANIPRPPVKPQVNAPTLEGLIGNSSLVKET